MFPIHVISAIVDSRFDQFLEFGGTGGSQTIITWMEMKSKGLLISLTT